MFNLFKSKSREEVVRVTVSNRTIIRLLILISLTFLLFMVLRRVSHALVLIFTSFFLALALNAPVHWLSERIPGKRKGSRSIATMASFLIVIAILVVFFASIVPPLVKQTNSFIHAAPQLVQQVHDQDSGLGKFVRKYHLTNEVNSFSNQLGNRLQKVGGTAFSTITKLTTSVFSVLIIFVLTYMMLVEGPRWLDVFRRLLPEDSHAHADSLCREMYKVIKGYVNGQVLLAAIAAVVIVIPLFILNISYPIALMVVVFFCALIPLVGHTIGATIITIVALFHSPLAAIIILAYYILYMQIEAYVIQPQIQANSTNMSPLLVFIAVVVGISFDGLLGGLVAIPLFGCLRVLVLDYLGHHNLFDNGIIRDTK